MIQILKYTTDIPMQMIGELAGICWNSKTDSSGANYRRAIDCIESNHGRVEEFPDVYCVIKGYSARCLRELYTHIGGAPTRLQESTRYVNCGNFDYYTGATIDNEEKEDAYVECMNNIAQSYAKLIELGVSKEDAANVLPLGMLSKMVWKINLRTLINFMNQRLCGRAYLEIRELALELKKALADYSFEWKQLSNNLFLPKCIYFGKCTEKKPCGNTQLLKNFKKESWDSFKE